MPDWKKAEAVARKCGTRRKADVLMLNGPIFPPTDHKLIEMCRTRRRRHEVLLVLTTPGGSAHTAYRVGRCLQRYYDRLVIYIPGWCKSAGTLLAVAAHELIVGEFAELGPIDVQSPKPDELLERRSGLTEEAALGTLERTAWKMFADFVSEIKELSQGQITFKTAAEVASTMVVGALQPVLAQIDPMRIGENSRDVKIANDYGLRLASRSRNLRSPRSMENLVSGYSSHGFDIDRDEASQLFVNVSQPDKELEQLCEAMGPVVYHPQDSTQIRWLNPEVKLGRKAKKVKKGKEDDTGIRQTAVAGGASTAADDGRDSPAAARTTSTGSRSNVRPITRHS